MKWACKNTLKVAVYSIDIENIISPVYHLILDLLSDREQSLQFDEGIGKIFNISLLTGQNQIKNFDEESFLVEITHYLEDCMYKKVCLLENSDILLLYRTKHIFISLAKKRAQVDLINWIKQVKLMDDFLDLVNNTGISNIKETLSKFINEQYFGNYVHVKESEIKSTFIPKKFIKDYTELPIDEDSIWLCSNLKEKLGVQENSKYSEIVFPHYDGYCIAINDYILATEYIDEMVTPEFSTEYFWSMLNNVYAQRIARRNIYHEKCQDFANAFRNAEFAKLMKNLQYNLYLQQLPTETPDKFKQFFEEVYNIELFKDEANHILFTGSHVAEQVDNKQTMFGLYKTEKNDTEFNLRAWINVETANRQKMTTGSGERIVEIKTVYALKPHYSYYFCKDYFEDMFADLLGESGITSLSNFRLYKSDAPDKCFIEIDQMVRKTDRSLVYIETKTTLNRFNIEETVNAVTRFHQIMVDSYPDVQIKYMLVSPYYNKTVEETFSYFINASGSSIHDFKIPIIRYNGIDLHCIVEPEYDKLKARIEKLLK